MANTVYMQCLLGMQCKQFAILAADQSNIHSIVVMKNDETKLHSIHDHVILGVNGDSGDIAQFSQFIEKNIALYRMRNTYSLSPAAVVHFTRNIIAESLRTGNPYMLNSMLACYDKELGGQLYTMDYLAASIQLPFACHGFAGFFCLSIMDSMYNPNLTEAEAYEVLQSCVKEIQLRLFTNLPNFMVKVVNKDGVKELPVISAATLAAKADVIVEPAQVKNK